MEITGITVGQLMRFLSDKDPETRILIQPLGGPLGAPLLSTEWRWEDDCVVFSFAPAPDGPADNVKYIGMTEDGTRYAP